MDYLLDTATWANGVTTPQVLPVRIRELVKHAGNKGLSGVSLLECAIHHRYGRLAFKGSLATFFEIGLSSDVELLDVTPAIAAETNALPKAFPGDPFDRTIAATARVLSLTLITPDPAIRDAKFCRVDFYPFRPSRGWSSRRTRRTDT